MFNYIKQYFNYYKDMKNFYFLLLISNINNKYDYLHII